MAISKKGLFVHVALSLNLNFLEQFQHNSLKGIKRGVSTYCSYCFVSNEIPEGAKRIKFKNISLMFIMEDYVGIHCVFLC